MLCALQNSAGATMPVSVWTSTLRRTIQTAEAIPFPKLRWKVLPPHTRDVHGAYKRGALHSCVFPRGLRDFARNPKALCIACGSIHNRPEGLKPCVSSLGLFQVLNPTPQVLVLFSGAER